LLFSTDAGFHYAGDGKLGGIVKPNDGECHTNERGEYTHGNILDYPSVSQINKVAKEENINIIFAVTSKQTRVYTELAKVIEGSSTGTLSENSSNIVTLVKNEYAKITRKLAMKDNATAPVRIKYFSKCKGKVEMETNLCDGLLMGDTVDFRLEVSVDYCPKDPNLWKQTIEVSPVALQDNIIIDLEMFCSCACEKPGHPHYKPRSPLCSGVGTHMCGICNCPGTLLGKECECDSADPKIEEGSIDDTKCKDNSTMKICSGRGNCECGQCKCTERADPKEEISGPFCQCTNFLCPRHDGMLCGGPDKGTCECSKCVCKDGWEGEDCSCSSRTDQCYNPLDAPDKAEECSGHGECRCNRCQCDKGDGGVFSGKFCEDCSTCEGKCSVYHDCVLCQVFDAGKLAGPDCAKNCSHLFNATKHVEVSANEDLGEKPCSFFDENDCRFEFVYGYDEDNNPVVRVQQTLECPPKLDILGIVLGVIGAIVAVGLGLLFLWKGFTTIHDRREYAKFEKEKMMAKWDAAENPIFKQATSTFQNPMYGKR